MRPLILLVGLVTLSPILTPPAHAQPDPEPILRIETGMHTAPISRDARDSWAEGVAQN